MTVEPEMVDYLKETVEVVFPVHNRTDAHVNSESDSRHKTCTNSSHTKSSAEKRE